MKKKQNKKTDYKIGWANVSVRYQLQKKKQK